MKKPAETRQKMLSSYHTYLFHGWKPDRFRCKTTWFFVAWQTKFARTIDHANVKKNIKLFDVNHSFGAYISRLDNRVK